MKFVLKRLPPKNSGKLPEIVDVLYGEDIFGVEDAILDSIRDDIIGEIDIPRENVNAFLNTTGENNTFYAGAGYRHHGRSASVYYRVSARTKE